MKTAKKLILYSTSFFLIFVFVYLGLSFAFPKPKKTEPVFIRVMGLWEPDVFNNIKKEFQDKHPEVTVEYEQKSTERYLEILKADLKSEKAPDVFWWHSGWGPLLRSNLAPLPENIMDTKTYESTFYPITKTDSKIGTTYRGLPLEIDGLALLYNKKLFATRNFNEPPTTWTTLKEQYVPALTSSNNKQIFNSAIALGSVANVENFPEIIGLFLLQSGVEFTKEGQLTLLETKKQNNNQLAFTAIDYYTSFSRKERTWDNTLPNSIEAFAEGKTAMVVLPLYKIHNLLDFIRGQNLSLDFGVAPLPQLPDAPTITWGRYWQLGVSQESKNKEAAWQLAKFLVEPDALRQVYENDSKINDFGRAYPRVDMAKEQTTNQYLAAYLIQAKDAKSWYLHSDTHDKVFNDALISIFKNGLSNAEKGNSTSGILRRITVEIRPILEKYGVTKKVQEEE